MNENRNWFSNTFTFIKHRLIVFTIKLLDKTETIPWYYRQKFAVETAATVATTPLEDALYILNSALSSTTWSPNDFEDVGAPIHALSVGRLYCVQVEEDHLAIVMDLQDSAGQLVVSGITLFEFLTAFKADDDLTVVPCNS